MAALSSLRWQQPHFTELQRARFDITNSFFFCLLEPDEFPCLQQLLTNSDSLHEENECEWNINKALLDPFKAGTFPELRADFKSLQLCN